MELRHGALLGILLAVGCAEDSNTGTLVIPVQHRASDGTLYHLTGTIELFSYVTSTQIELESTPNDEVLEVDVAADGLWLASTEVSLLDVSSDGGAWRSVEAAQPPRGNELPADLVAAVERHERYTMKFTFLVHEGSGETRVTFDLP